MKGAVWYSLDDQSASDSPVSLINPGDATKGIGKQIDLIESNALWGELMETKGNPITFVNKQALGE